MITNTALYRELGLTDDEYERIKQRLGRDPNYTELAMFSVMWSEHCSYKSSRIHLRTLPTEGEQVVVGPGEGAGVINVAPGLAVAWKAESHNHPSFVEPFNGAATGVGGIVRDILSMGARPIALMDPLRFGHLDNARTRYLVDGVVSGISAYGNSIGVPTVGGEMVFEDCYAENPLVNVACLGVIETRLMHGRAEGPGNAVVLIGSSTGRDGIGGASVLASAEFDESSAEKRPSVQVGDPLAEKLLIEACLELIASDLVVGIQDLGAGGISCPTSEMSSKASTGMRIDIDKVHRREPGMEPFEVMISESQERMLVVVDPAKLQRVLEVCARWDLLASVVGEVTTGDAVEVVDAALEVARVPAHALAEEGPVYERALQRPTWLDDLQRAAVGDEPPGDMRAAFLSLLSSPNICSKRWTWEQYDHMLFLGTVIGPGGDAAVVRLPDSDVAVALSTDGPGRFCYLDPYEGARLAVCEAARNVACTGATPLAITNCLNLGNPEKPEVVWQFAEVIRGLGDSCRALNTPVTGGNVSFYNETNGRAIYPTPVIGMLGSMPDASVARGLGFVEPGDAIVLLGETNGFDFGGSEYGKVVNGAIGGRPPALDIERERALITFLARNDARIRNAHDCSDGGLAIALAESALRGNVGFSLDTSFAVDHRELFAESPSRAIVGCRSEDFAGVIEDARAAELPATVIGRVGGDSLDFGLFSVPLEEARARFEGALERVLSGSMD